MAGIDTATAKFVSGHLRNNLMPERSFLYVEKSNNFSMFQQSITKNASELRWDIIFVDTDLETKIEWCRENYILGESTVEIQWSISNSTEPGLYRIRHVGYYKVSNASVHYTFAPNHLLFFYNNRLFMSS